MTKADVQEALVVLYLRLNGYFTSGFIVHSPEAGRVRTELDVLAVRFPQNAEPERGVGGDDLLARWNQGIDFIIGEVKSHGQAHQFNPAVGNVDAITRVLRWWGHLNEEEIKEKAPEVSAMLEPSPGAREAPTAVCPRDARVRAILFSPETNKRHDSQAWFIPGPPIFDFVHRCLHPPQRREECATNYGAGQWGIGLAKVVEYFKAAGRTHPGDFRQLLGYMGVED